MPLAQLRLCSVLQCGPRPLSDIARTLGISASAVSQLADRLENAGMVERAPGEDEDRRVKRLRLTPGGEALMHERRALRREHVAAALCRLPTDERGGVLASLRALLQASACISEAPEIDRELEPITVRLEITGD
jgi:DNA-binding MarR family transcriptional regulator